MSKKISKNRWQDTYFTSDIKPVNVRENHRKLVEKPTSEVNSLFYSTP